MNRRELFTTLGAVLGAAIGSKVVAKKPPVSISMISQESAKALSDQMEMMRLIANPSNESWIKQMYDYEHKYVGDRDFIYRHYQFLDPIADIANRPDNAQRIFEFVANTSCQYTGVSYVEFNDPTVIISGDCGTSKSSVLITPTSIRYRTITNQGQEIIHDAKTQKVIDFIRTLGYDFQ